MASVLISVTELMKKAKDKFGRDFDLQMHRFPAGLRGVGERYVVPMVVAIGPYYHHHKASDLLQQMEASDHLQQMEASDLLQQMEASDHLQQMELVKAAAASHLMEFWGSKPFEAVLKLAGGARELYAKDALVGMVDADFAAMMFIDACFLLQYMDAYTSFETGDYNVDKLLRSFLFSRRDCINNDIMLLENQLPLLVLQTIMNSLRNTEKEKYMEAVGKFIVRMANTFNICEDKHDQSEQFVWPSSESQQPPHLLGLLRWHKTKGGTEVLQWPEINRLSASSAIELAEIGIKLTAREKAVFTDMDVKERGLFCGELSLAPLSLNDTRACWLVNMAAFEVATGSSYREDDAAVCSYLGLLGMFMLRQEDVQELRSKCILYGHQSNTDMLNFFKSVVKHLPDTGKRFANIMVRIEDYKNRRWVRTKVHKFVYKNWRTIITVITVVGTLVSIIKTLQSLKQGQKNHAPAQYLSFLPA